MFIVVCFCLFCLPLRKSSCAKCIIISSYKLVFAVKWCYRNFHRQFYDYYKLGHCSDKSWQLQPSRIVAATANDNSHCCPYPHPPPPLSSPTIPSGDLNLTPVIKDKLKMQSGLFVSPVSAPVKSAIKRQASDLGLSTCSCGAGEMLSVGTSAYQKSVFCAGRSIIVVWSSSSSSSSSFSP